MKSIKLGKTLASTFILAAALNAGDTSAAVLYSTDSDTNSLVRIDVNAGTASVVAPLDRNSGRISIYSSLDFNPSDGQLYFGDRQFSPNTLSIIDTKTGSLTGIPTRFSRNLTENIAFNPNNNLLYMAERSHVFTIDVNSKQVDFFHALPLDIDAIEFDSEGLMWLVDVVSEPGGWTSRIYQHDISTKTTTFLNSNSHVNLLGLAWAEDGNLYGIDVTSDDLYRINSNGSIDFVMEVGNFSGLNNLAAQPAQPSVSVSEPSTIFGLLAFGIIGAGSALKRKLKLKSDKHVQEN